MSLNLSSLRERCLFFLFFSVLVAMYLAPLASNSLVPYSFDMYNHIELVAQAKLAFIEGQFPLRIAPLEPWRYPVYQFYSPTTYTVAGLIHRWLIPSNPYIALKLIIWASLVFGMIYLYRLAYWLVGSRVAALLAALVYLMAPYSVTLVNHFGAFNEAIAVGLLPAILYYSFMQYLTPSTKNFLVVTLLYYLILTVHLITFLCAFVFIGGLFLAMTLLNRHHFKNLMILVLAVLFAGVLGMWFLVPIAKLGAYTFVGSDIHVSDYYNLMLGNFISPGLSIFDQYHIMMKVIRPSLGLPVVLAFICGCYIWMNQYKLSGQRANVLAPYFLTFFLLAFLLAWSPIDFWHWLPKSLCILQYSWRLMSVLLLLGALIFAWALVWLFAGKLDERHFVIGLLLIMASASPWFVNVEHNTKEFFVENPKMNLAWVQEAYYVYPRAHPAYISQIDSVALRASDNESSASPDKSDANVFALDFVSKDQLLAAKNLYFIVKGNVVNLAPDVIKSVTVFVNGTSVGDYVLQAGDFSWKILPDKVRNIKKDTKFHFEFKLNKSASKADLSKFSLTYKKIILGSFADPQKFISVRDSRVHCQQKGEDTICKVIPPRAVTTVELPILYYPGLQQVTINGKKVSYQGILNEGALLVGIKPEPGIENTVNVRFTGVIWANYLSQLAWVIWVIVLIGYLGSRVSVFRAKRTLTRMKCHRLKIRVIFQNFPT